MRDAPIRAMSKGVDRFTNLRAWRACVAYKKAVYRLCLESPLARDWKRRDQLEDSVAGPPGHLSEGFGRFSPPDFARFTVMARSSLMESQNHLRDAVDKNYITEETRLQLDALAEIALQEVTGLMEYLQSPEALRNARRARERRIASRERRMANRDLAANKEPTNQKSTSQNPRTQNPEPNLEQEPRSEKSEG